MDQLNQTGVAQPSTMHAHCPRSLDACRFAEASEEESSSLVISI